MIHVGNQRYIGVGQPCFIAAEVGINHNGDMELAKKSIDAAVESGVDSVKFQNYYTEDFLSDRSLQYEYISQGVKVVESQYDMFKRCELTRENLVMLREYCDKRGITFFSTPTSDRGIEDLVQAKSPLLKNGSDYLGNLPLIRTMARTQIPTILSTGMATIADIDDAARAFREAGGKDLILLHCTSSYPTPDTDTHLRKIPSLAAAFACPVGFSDHTEGTTAAIASVLLGACFIEKHFTLDRNLPGPDHRFSSTPEEMADLVRSVRRVEAQLGDSAIGPAASEKQGRQDYRLSCVAATDLKAGHILTERDIAFRRPATGLPPKFSDWLLGKKLAEDMRLGTPITLDLILSA